MNNIILIARDVVKITKIILANKDVITMTQHHLKGKGYDYIV